MATFYTDSASIDVLEVSSSLLVSGTLILSGSVSSQGGYTGSLLGTASWAENARTASFVTTAQTASYVLQAVSSSFSTTASFAVSASWAPGGGSIGGSGTANRVTKFTAATTLGDSSIFDSGSNLQITSSMITVSGSDTRVAFTSSFFGVYQTASQYNSKVELQVKNASVDDVNAQSIVNVIGDRDGGVQLGTNTSGYIPLPGANNNAVANDSFIANTGQGVLHIYNTATGSEAAIKMYAQGDSFLIGPKEVLIVTGSEVFVDTLVATGSLFGTSSWARNVLTASNVNPLNQTVLITGSLLISGALLEVSGALRANDGIIAQTVTASFTGSLTGALIGTASWANNSVTASFVTTAQTASYVLQAVSSSFATSASFAVNSNPFPFTGSAIITGSLNVIGSGSNIFVVSGSLGALLNVSEKTAADTRLFTVSSASVNLLTVNDDKSTRISGSLIVTGSITGSLFGSASFATTSSFSTTSSFAITASFALNAGGGGSGTGFPFTGSAVITGSLLISTGSAAFAPSPALTASEALTAGDIVNIGPGGVRRATNNDTTKQAHGYVITGVSANASTVVYYNGLNTSETGLTVGSRYFLGTAGAVTTTPPTTAGQLSQEVGVAVSTTALLVNFGPAIVT